jgi:hypothetical protein
MSKARSASPLRLKNRAASRRMGARKAGSAVLAAAPRAWSKKAAACLSFPTWWRVSATSASVKATSLCWLEARKMLTAST